MIGITSVGIIIIPPISIRRLLLLHGLLGLSKQLLLLDPILLIPKLLLDAHLFLEFISLAPLACQAADIREFLGIIDSKLVIFLTF